MPNLTLTGNEITDSTRLAGTLVDTRTPPDSSFGVNIPATNLALQSTTLGVAPWVLTNATVAATTGPFGRNDGNRLTITGAPTVEEVLTVAPSTTYMFSFYACRGTRTAASYAVYDVTHGAYLVGVTDYYPLINSSSYTLLQIPVTTPAGCTSLEILPLQDFSGTTGTLDIYGVQLETGSIATLRVPTTTVAVTRGAPRIQAPANLLSAVQVWIASRLRPESLAGLAGARLAHAQQDANNLIELVQDGGQWIMRRVTAGLVEEAGMPASAVSGTTQTVIGKLTAAGPSISVAGSAYRSTTVYDDFQRADAASLGTAPSGQAWSVTGPDTARIVSNRAVLQASPVSGNAYNLIQAPGTPTRIWARALWPSASGTAVGTNGFTMITSTDVSNNLTHVCHFGTTPTGWFLQSGAAGSFTNLGGGTWATPLAADTVYHAAMAIEGNTITLDLADGTTFSVTDASIGVCNGPYLQYEIGTDTVHVIPSLLTIGCETVSDTPVTGRTTAPAISTSLYDIATTDGSGGYINGEILWQAVGQGAVLEPTQAFLLVDTDPTLGSFAEANDCRAVMPFATAAYDAGSGRLAGSLTLTPELSGVLSLE